MRDTCEVIICEGPPACPYSDNEAIENAKSGCPICRRIKINPDGTETEYKLKSQ